MTDALSAFVRHGPPAHLKILIHSSAAASSAAVTSCWSWRVVWTARSRSARCPASLPRTGPASCSRTTGATFSCRTIGSTSPWPTPSIRCRPNGWPNSFDYLWDRSEAGPGPSGAQALSAVVCRLEERLQPGVVFSGRILRVIGERTLSGALKKKPASASSSIETSL